MALTTVLAVLPASGQAATTSGACQKLDLKVSLGPGQPANQTISGTFCQPTQWAAERHIDILLHGATYSNEYWNWPTSSPQYSFTERSLQAGRATFAYDRLGTGQSSRPASALVTVESDAAALHQAIQHFRTAYGFSKVTTIGHSLGSVVAQYEAGKYRDVDRLVVTALMHAQGPGTVQLLAGFYPAGLDPQFSGLLDVGYLTTTPGARGVFYNGTADPQVKAYDEAHKHVVSSVQLAESFPFTLTPPILNVTAQITAPVLSVVGQDDVIICGLLLDCGNAQQLQNFEAPYYPNAASLTTHAVPNTGHNIALHPSAGASFATINTWIENH